MSIINNTRLEEFANGLWAKIKTKIGDSVVNITFDPLTSILTATKSNAQIVTVDLKELIGVKDVTYSELTKTITVTKGDNSNSQIDLSTFVEDWKDLSHVKEIATPNLFVEGRLVRGYWYSDTGVLQANSAWSYYVTDFEISPNQVYRRLANSNTDSVHCAFLNENNQLVEAGRWTKVDNVHNKHTYELTIPNNPDIKKFTMNLQHKIGQENGLYLWDNATPPAEAYIPYSDGASILIDGTKVSTSFDPKDSSIKSTTLASAIREVDSKIISSNNSSVKSVNGQMPNNNGNVTLNANHFNDIYSKTESDGKFVLQSDVANTAGKIPRLNAQGKLETSILPKIAINETFVFPGATFEEAQNKAMQQEMETGDLAILNVNTESRKYLCAEPSQNQFQHRFIELTFPTDGVTEGELNTILQEYVRQDETGTSANQVLRLDEHGQIADANLKIATSNEINDIINALQ